jgi:hypothetical protein
MPLNEDEANTFTINDYCSILNKSIRLGVKVPFNCYIFLKVNQKVILFIKANGSPNENLDSEKKNEVKLSVHKKIMKKQNS